MQQIFSTVDIGYNNPYFPPILERIKFSCPSLRESVRHDNDLCRHVFPILPPLVHFSVIWKCLSFLLLMVL